MTPQPEKPRRKPYQKPRLKYDHKIQAVAGLCEPEPGTFFKNQGDINPFGNPCADVFT